MPGLDPGIHVFLSSGVFEVVDARNKCGHDDKKENDRVILQSK
jgi:hypothetical protein